MSELDNKQLWLIYDGECPFCSSYVRFVRIRESFGSLNLVNAREGGELVERVIEEGFDLDEGMVLKYGDRYNYGAECITTLSLMSTGSGLFNKINGVIFRNAAMSRMLYPVLRAGRNLTLRLVRRKNIDNGNSLPHPNIENGGNLSHQDSNREDDVNTRK